MKTKAIIKAIIERRQMAAIKNQISTKLFIIAQNLGKPVVSTGYTQKFIDHSDPERVQEIGEDEEWTEYDMGWYFDALRFGINFSVLVLCTDDEMSEDKKPVSIKLDYNGRLVFSEIEGRIRAYNPSEAWEKPLEELYLRAASAEKRRKERNGELKKEADKAKLDKAWAIIKNLWGGG